jgi:hypothetical protein
VATLIAARETAAHGSLDQYLLGDPGCNATNFPQSAPLDATLRQEFVPSGASLSSIGVCLQSTAASGTIVSLAVREGSALSPGSLVGALNVTAPAGATAYVHADFPAALTIAAGDTYVIELAPASSQIAWRGAPDGVDWYAAGSSNTSIADFAFRAYLAPAAPTATNTPLATAPAATSTTAPTKTPTKSPTKTATPISTPTIAPATSTPELAATATAVTAAPTQPPPPATAAAAPAGTRAPPASTAAGPGSAPASISATPPPSVTRTGVALARVATPRAPDGPTTDARDADGGGSGRNAVMMAVAGLVLLGGAGAGAYGFRRWRMRT